MRSIDHVCTNTKWRFSSVMITYTRHNKGHVCQCNKIANIFIRFERHMPQIEPFSSQFWVQQTMDTLLCITYDASR